MNQLKSPFIDVLARINFTFKNESILTECIKDFDGFHLFGKKIGPFKKGKKYPLRFFLALPLIQHNILSIDVSQKCDHIDVQRYAISERDDQRIIKPNEKFFLNKLKEFKHIMRKDIENKVKNQMDLDRFNSYMSNIVDGRLFKLLRMAKSKLKVNEEQRLTISERVLYQEINHLLEIWRKFFLDLVDKKEKN
ncbi:MAG: hypothetical protein EU544_06550 [Promethearchaeota archaeon]|nr:MAG: hypothetical protein EU544_06550 [Candidatus Lokiarchaeota archaeon]